MTSDELKQTVAIPPVPPEPGDSRLDSFLQKAAPVIAVERGINARSRIKLEAIARDMHLPDDLFEQGIHMLQGAPPVEKGGGNRWADAFRQYLHAKLENLPRKILTFRLEARVIAVAASKFQLAEDEARDIIRKVAKEHEVRRVSQSEAERYVAHLIEHKVGDAAWLDDNTVTRLHAVGNEWGLSSEQVDAVIRQYTYENRKRQDRERRNTMITLTIAGAVVVGLICGLAFLVYQNNAADPAEDKTAGSSTAKDKSNEIERPKPRRLDPPDWWDSDLTIAVSRCRVDRNNLPNFGEVYLQIASDDPTERAAGYGEVVRLAEAAAERNVALDRLREIIVRCYSLEPDDGSSNAICEALLDVDTTPVGELPPDESHYARLLRMADIAVGMLTHDDLPDARAQSLEQSLSDMLDVSFNRNENEVALRQKANLALLERFYRQLIAAVPRHVSKVYPYYSRLTVLGHTLLDLDRLDRLETEFMAAVVPASGNAWRQYEGLIDACIRGQDNNNVIKVLKVLVQSQNRDLQTFIASRLVQQFDIAPPTLSPEDVTAAVRDKLGIKTPVVAATSRSRWEELQQQVAKVFDSGSPRASNPEEVLQRTVKLSYFTTLALALAQQDPGFPVFDQLIEEGAPDISAGKSRDDASPFRADRGERVVRNLGVIETKKQKLREYIAQLRYPARMNSAQRLTRLRQIAQLTHYLEDISTEQANILVFYLLVPKSNNASENDEEYSKATLEVPDLARWNRFLLALADNVAEHDVKANNNNQKVISAALGKAVEIGPDVPHWQEYVQRRLMQKVAARAAVRRRIAASSPAKKINNAADALLDLYATRARLLGATSAECNSLTSPSDALKLLVSRTAANFKSSSKLLAQLPHRLTVVDFLADNDLRRTVLLQRLWIELAAAEVAQKYPASATNAAAIVDELRVRGEQRASAVQQLYDGERAILDVWMLLAP